MRPKTPGSRLGFGAWEFAALLAFLAAFLAVQYPDALAIPFINDDYLFLEKTRTASFPSLWGFRDLTFHWYRPWSRELHYWTLQRVFGAREGAFHLVSLVLWAGVMAAYYALARRLAGRVAAGVAVAGVVAMAAWAVPLLWVAGVQDLWMLLWSLCALLALARGAGGVVVAATALALLSKETAAVLPGILVLYVLVIERRGWREALRRAAPVACVVVLWAAAHPMLGGRLVSGISPERVEGLHPPLVRVVLQTVLALVNLSAVPAPLGSGFLPRALFAAALAAAFVALVAWRVRAKPDARAASPDAPAASPDARVASPDALAVARSQLLLFAAGWALLGWLPVLSPSLGWRAYYTLLGALGAWLAIAVLLASRPVVAAGVVAIVAGLGAAAAETPSRDWGTAWYQRRAGTFLAFMRDDLARKVPRPPAHSRLFFSEVPNNVGFVTSGAPALRQWYRDTTLSGDFLRDYAARSTGTPLGPDYFFRYDSTSGWVVVLPDSAGGTPSNPRWEADQREVAAAMVRARDWSGAGAQWERLAARRPDVGEYPLNAGICHEMRGDSGAAVRAYERAARVPGLREEDRRFIAEFKFRHLPSR